jgi:hypothetical protein
MFRNMAKRVKKRAQKSALFRRQVSNFIQTQDRYWPKLIDTGRAPTPPVPRAREPRPEPLSVMYA